MPGKLCGQVVGYVAENHGGKLGTHLECDLAAVANQLQRAVFEFVVPVFYQDPDTCIGRHRCAAIPLPLQYTA